MSSRIIISSLVVPAIIGVHPHERLSEQLLSIDLSFFVDLDNAASRDSLSDTHDYSKICEAIIFFVKKTPCQLLETLTKRLSDYLKNTFQLSALELTITKKPIDIPNVGGVSVQKKK